MASTSGHGSPREPVPEGVTKDIIVESEIIMDFLQGVEGAKCALEEAAGEGVLRLSAMSAAEVMAASGEEQRDRTAGLICSFGVVPVDGEVALNAGVYFSDGGAGKPGLVDCVVAATCERLGAILLTGGRRLYPVGGYQAKVVRY